MKPLRHSAASAILSSNRTFFVTTKTSMGRRLLQSERNASLFIEVLRSYVAAKKFQVHDFVVMPDHVHILLTVGAEVSIERAMQLIKGDYSYRLKTEAGYAGEVWQHGFSEVRVDDQRSRQMHHEYIARNPVKAGLVESPEMFPYCFTYLSRQKQQGPKPKQRRKQKPGRKPWLSLSNQPSYGVTGLGAFFGVLKYPVMLFLSAVNTTIS
jgi:putative transposase